MAAWQPWSYTYPYGNYVYDSAHQRLLYFYELQDFDQYCANLMGSDAFDHQLAERFEQGVPPTWPASVVYSCAHLKYYYDFGTGTYTDDLVWYYAGIEVIPYQLTDDRDRLSISGPEKVAPAESAKDVTVTVRNCNGNPKSGVAVTVTNVVGQTSGYHEGVHQANRPKGLLSATSGSTNRVGEFKLDFLAPRVAGTHTLTAKCSATNSKCSPATVDLGVDVKVEGLEQIPTSSLYSLKTEAGNNIGNNTKHDDVNHYLSIEAIAVLERLAFEYAASFENPADRIPEKLYINDASLGWGGLFDIGGGWLSPHFEHDRGTDVDIRANRDSQGNLNEGAIPQSEFDRFKDQAGLVSAQLDIPVDAAIHCSRRLDLPEVQRPKQPLCLLPDGTVDSNRHFHVRLLGESE